MKKYILACWLMAGCCGAQAQVQELEQLMLNIEKLAQFKQVLTDLKKGYDILFTGYNTIKDLSSGNFSLHKTFLDGLLDVSPAVRRYKGVAGIIQLQLQLVKEYKAAFRQWNSGNRFNPAELNYINNVYRKLFNGSLDNLNDLLSVITAGTLRMSDHERLTAIDKIYADMQGKVNFLRQFNSSTAILGMQRSREQQEIDAVRGFYNIQK